MSNMEYTYAVARIRVMELDLFSASTIDQLVACKTYENCLQFLVEKGWGDADTPMEAEAILAKEREKTWKEARSLVKQETVFDVLSYPNLFHNLKAAIKETVTADVHRNIYFDNCKINGGEMARIISEKDFSALPENMREAAKEAYETFLHTRDSQLCDVIVDRACLDAVCLAGRSSNEQVIRDYAESSVAVADIKIAARSLKTGKSLEFMRRAMAPCASLSVDRLSSAAMAGLDAVCEYLEGTAYREGGHALKESPSAFERWCDNQIIEAIKPQKMNPFSAGPVIAYVLARENEIKTVRIILSGKQNQLPDESIRERIREMYV